MELSIQDVWLLIYKAGPVRAALTNLLVVLWWPHLAQGGEQHPVKMADTEAGVPALVPGLGNHLKLFYL